MMAKIGDIVAVSIATRDLEWIDVSARVTSINPDGTPVLTFKLDDADRDAIWHYLAAFAPFDLAAPPSGAPDPPQ